MQIYGIYFYQGPKMHIVGNPSFTLVKALLSMINANAAINEIMNIWPYQW